MNESTKQLAAEFNNSMTITVEEGMKRGYYPSYFVQMVHQHGGVETAKRLLAKREIQAGLLKLYELDLLDSSLEAYVIRDRFAPLFTEAERQEAKRRLEELGYFRNKR